jgi:cellulose synthase/poly-beta-1,6-N-acetylglucosamine synthase-like glycosyltransferase
MKEPIIQQCLDILKREDIRYELKAFCGPIIDLVFRIINPYIYIVIFLVFLIFIMILTNLILLIFILRNKNMIVKNI